MIKYFCDSCYEEIPTQKNGCSVKFIYGEKMENSKYFNETEKNYVLCEKCYKNIIRYIERRQSDTQVRV